MATDGKNSDLTNATVVLFRLLLVLLQFMCLTESGFVAWVIALARLLLSWHCMLPTSMGTANTNMVISMMKGLVVDVSIFSTISVASCVTLQTKRTNLVLADCLPTPPLVSMALRDANMVRVLLCREFIAPVLLVRRIGDRSSNAKGRCSIMICCILCPIRLRFLSRISILLVHPVLICPSMSRTKNLLLEPLLLCSRLAIFLCSIYALGIGGLEI